MQVDDEDNDILPDEPDEVILAQCGQCGELNHSINDRCRVCGLRWDAYY